jgi:hypothetical protein
MQCYYHPSTAAVGICKYCGRGLCNACAATVEGDVLACHGRHEQQVRAEVEALARSIQQANRLGAGYGRNAIFYGLAGAAFAVFGAMEFRFLGLQGVFFTLIGLFLLYAAVANFIEGRKYR